MRGELNIIILCTGKSKFTQKQKKNKKKYEASKRVSTENTLSISISDNWFMADTKIFIVNVGTIDWNIH